MASQSIAQPSTTRPKVGADAVPLDRLWTHDQTADYLGIPPGTLHAWNSRGIGPRSFRVGRYRRYDPADVRRWLDERASELAPPGDAA
jgi:hypothetical protein